MVGGLFFCATLTGRREGHTPFVQAGAETCDTGAEAVEPDPGSSWEGHSRRVVPVSGIKVRSLVEFVVISNNSYANHFIFNSGVTRGLSQGGKLGWKAPTSQPSEKTCKMMANPADGGGHAKTLNRWKLLRKTQKTTTYWKPKEYWNNGNGLLFHMTHPTSRSTMKAIACSKPTISEH